MYLAEKKLGLTNNTTFCRKQPRRRRDVSDGSAIVEKDTLDWGNDSMRPSAALQERLKGLQSTAPAFVSVEEEDDAEEQLGFSGMPSNGGFLTKQWTPMQYARAFCPFLSSMNGSKTLICYRTYLR